MKIRHIRNATTILTIAGQTLLIDPMLSDVGVMPGFKLFGGGRRRNPLVPLPAETDRHLKGVTGVIITHEHPDHFDRPALQWIIERGLPVWANRVDAANLARKGLDVRDIEDSSLGIPAEVIPSRHGRGLLGWLMGPVAGYYLAHPDEPSIYLIGDSILTDSVLDAIDRLQPDMIIAPAGAANVGVGGDILFSLDEMVTLVKRTQGQVIFNHLEALDHCPTTRTALRERLTAEGLLERVHIPADGAEISSERSHRSAHIAPRAIQLKPGFQKWFTARLAGT